MRLNLLSPTLLQLACWCRVAKWQWEPRSTKDVFCKLFLMLFRHAGCRFCMFVRVGQSCSCHWGTGVFNQTSSPQLRPHGRSVASPTRQDFKGKKQLRYHWIRHVCATCWSPKKQEHLRDTVKTYKGNFRFSFPSRANVVKVTHLNVIGSEALISWAPGNSANVPWRFKWHNVWSRSTMIHLRFPRLSKCQESTVRDMDCDDSFGGYNRSDGVGCAKCDPGSVFVKNITKTTITNRSALQHCVPCPDGASICTATAIEMLPGCLVRKSCGAKELCTVFCLNLMPMWMLQANFVPCTQWLWGRMVGQDISRGFHCPNPLACPRTRANVSVNTNTSTWMCAPGLRGNVWKHFPVVKLIEVQSPGTCPRIRRCWMCRMHKWQCTIQQQRVHMPEMCILALCSEEYLDWHGHLA